MNLPQRICLLSLVLPLCGILGAQSPYSLLDPHIGTANEGQTVPLVGEPYAMTNWVPETRSTEDKCIAPYYFADTRLTGIRASHWMTGSCTQDYGSVTLMTTFGALHTAPESRAITFQHSTEVAQPAFYSVQLPDDHETVELTGGIRAGILRARYTTAGDVNLIVENNARFHDGWVHVDIARGEITGYNPVHRIYQGNGKLTGFSGYFVVQLQQRAQSDGTWCDDRILNAPELKDSSCKHMGAYLRLHLSAPGDLLIRTGTSFTSLEAARSNLRAEIPAWNFEALRTKTTRTWNNVLNTVSLEGGSAAQRRTFYTALYHSQATERSSTSPASPTTTTSPSGTSIAPSFPCSRCSILCASSR